MMVVALSKIPQGKSESMWSDVDQLMQVVVKMKEAEECLQ